MEERAGQLTGVRRRDTSVRTKCDETKWLNARGLRREDA